MRSKFLPLTIVFLLLLPLSVWGQRTSVSAVVRDSNGAIYAGGSYEVFLVNLNPPPGSPQPNIGGQTITSSDFLGRLDSFGAFSVSLFDNNQILPAGTKWRFSMCAIDKVTCFKTDITITGVTQDVSAALQAAAATLPVSAGGTLPWGSISGTLSNQTDLQTVLNAKAPVVSPAFTGTPTAPTVATNDNSTAIATTAWVKAQNYGTGTNATWGSITGTLSSQADLQNALNAKAPTDFPNFTGVATAPNVNATSGYQVNGAALNFSHLAGTANSSQMSTGMRTRSTLITIFDPVATDSGRVLVFDPGVNITITRVYCSVKAATNVVINLNKRTEAAIDTTGTNVLTSDLTCVTGGASTTTFSSAAVTAHTPVMLTITSLSGTPDTLRVAVEYTVDAGQ